MEVLKVSDIINKFLGRKRAEKKKKKLKEISERKVVKKKKSKRSEILNKIFNKKDINNQDIDKIIMENDIQLDDETKQYFYNLSKLKSDFNKRLSLPSNLITGDIVVYAKYNVKTDIISNDKLINTFILNAKIPNDKMPYVSFCNLVKVSSASMEPLIYNEKELVFYEYYVEDFSKYFSLATKNEDVKNSNNYKKENDVVADFKIGNDRYEGRSNTDYFIVYLKSFNTNKLDGLINEMKYMKKDKGELKSGIKTVKRGTGLFFFQQSFLTTDFSPSFVVLNNKYTFTYLAKLKINPEDMFNYLYDCINAAPDGNEDLPIRRDIITPDNIDAFMIMIDIITFLIPNSGFYKKIYTSYETCKENIFYIKQDYQMLKQIAVAFYDSFNLRLNLDKIASLYTLCNNYMSKQAAWSRYYSDTDVTDLFNFIGKYGIVFHNFITLDKVNFVSNIRTCCEAILNTKMNQNTNLEEIVRKVGVSVYSRFINDASTACFYEIRSPYGFLTNLVGDLDLKVAANDITDILKKIGASSDKSAMDFIQEESKQSPEAIVQNTQERMLYQTIRSTVAGVFNLDSMKTINTLIKQLPSNSGIKLLSDETTFSELDSVNTNLMTKAQAVNQNLYNTLKNNEGVIKTFLKLLILLREYLFDLSILAMKVGTENDIKVYNIYSNVIKDILVPNDGNYDNLIKLIDYIYQNQKTVFLEYIKNTFIEKPAQQQQQQQQAQGGQQQQQQQGGSWGQPTQQKDMGTWGNQQGGNQGGQ